MGAIAVGLVLVHNAGVRQLPGGFIGIDVLFVIGGFVITGLLIHDLEESGRLSLRRFYRRCANRLLPAVGVVLLVTAALVAWTTAEREWRTFGTDIVSAALGLVNWRLAARSADPFAASIGASPVHHLWALAVGQQLLLVWPVLFVVVVWWLRRRRHARLRAVLTLAVAVITFLSFVLSLVLTNSHPSTAYLASTTRLWELGIGALVAAGSTVWRRAPQRVGLIVGWAGIGAVAVSALVVAPGAPWPGYRALLPILGTAAVIIAGFTNGTAGASRLLSSRPMVWGGGLAFSLYLWHWPLLVAASALWGELGAKRGLLVVMASMVPAYVTHRLVEKPIQSVLHVSRSRRISHSVRGGSAFVGVVAGLALVLAASATPKTTSSPSSAAGAAVLHSDGVTTGGDGTVETLADVAWFIPDAMDAPDDLPDAYADGCQVRADSPDPVLCEYGDPQSEVVIAVVGDSKILQWQSALELIADTQGWRVVSYTKSSCGFHAAVQQLQGAAYTACTRWNLAVQAALVELAPDVVVTSQGEPFALADPDDPTSTTSEAMVEGLVASWTALLANEIEVVVLVDNPGPEINAYECVAENPEHLAACTFDRDQAVATSAAPTQTAAAARVPEVDLIDLRESICPFAECVPVIGNVLLWRQGTHITDTYAQSLAETLAEQLVPLVEGGS
ncbi:acyltransferase family protein [Pseudactinotalea suaedae]|uniref:acyltransferase family protein n=1 Tax=Pseudactinotalea suaedae TaxID=1524924 RepID=UPI0012E1B249|nr:acyltransferase family protein [Pseudactinotalea suaedae]